MSHSSHHSCWEGRLRFPAEEKWNQMTEVGRVEALNKQSGSLSRVAARLRVLWSSSGTGRTSEAETKKSDGGWGRRREGRSHQIKAQQEEKNLDGSQKAGTRLDRRQWRGARRRRTMLLLRCSFTVVRPALYSQRWRCKVLTHGPIHQVESCRRFGGGGGEKVQETCASFHCAIARSLTQPHSESVSQWVSVTDARDALAMHLQDVRVSEIQVKVKYLPASRNSWSYFAKDASEMKHLPAVGDVRATVGIGRVIFCSACRKTAPLKGPVSSIFWEQECNWRYTQEFQVISISLSPQSVTEGVNEDSTHPNLNYNAKIGLFSVSLSWGFFLLNKYSLLLKYAFIQIWK